MPKLEFDEKHKKGFGIPADEKKYIKRKIAALGVTVALFGGITYGFFVPHTRTVDYELSTDNRDSIVQINDQDVLESAELVDYYQTFDELNNSYIKKAQKSYDNDKNDNNKQNPTSEEFKKSLNSLLDNLSILDSKAWQSGKSAEEVTKIRNKAYYDLLRDYNVVLTYMEKHKLEDYNNFFDKTLENRIKEAFEKKGIYDIQINNIKLVEKGKDSYAIFNITINGEEKEFKANGLLLAIIENRYYISALQDINKIKKIDSHSYRMDAIIEDCFNIDLNNNTINNNQSNNNNNSSIAKNGLMYSPLILMIILVLIEKDRKTDDYYKAITDENKRNKSR